VARGDCSAYDRTGKQVTTPDTHPTMLQSVRLQRHILVVLAAALIAGAACSRGSETTGSIPRTADGKPDLQGIWQVRNRASYDLEGHVASQGILPGASVVQGGAIPYQEWAAAKKAENAANRKTADPVAGCHLPGIPRMMYMDYPFQIFQTPEHIAMTFEWSLVHRRIPMSGTPPDEIEFWMGDSRGRWEGDTLVVDVRNHNDKTWFDMAGNFHSEALQLVERYTLADANTINYEVTVTDPKVFTRPWTMAMSFHRVTEHPRLLEYQCHSEDEEAQGLFERDPKTWYPGPSVPVTIPAEWTPDPNAPPRQAPAPTGTFKRMPDGKPDLQGFFLSDGGGANYGLEKHERDFLTPEGRGVVVDPPDGLLPMQAWAKAEAVARNTPERGYDDPTAHCFVAGVPRSMYVPGYMQILQPPGYVVILHERMAWRIIPLDGRMHLPDNMRLWQGDSIGRWEGDTLVIETKNLNGKTWLNEVGEIVSHAETVVERLSPLDADTIHYEATVSDPLVYTRPWTIAFPIRRQKDEMLEVACLEGNEDLQHLKEIRDQARAKKARGR
jgi:hypothetical protein